MLNLRRRPSPFYSLLPKMNWTPRLQPDEVEGSQVGHGSHRHPGRIGGFRRASRVKTNYGVTHDLVEGQVEDDSGKMKLTICDEKIKQIDRVKVGDTVKRRTA